MKRTLLVVLCVAVLGAGCTRKHVATPEEVRANHDRAWTIESLPASMPAPIEAGEADDDASG